MIQLEDVDDVAVVQWVRRGKPGGCHYYGTPREMIGRLWDRVGRYPYFEKLGPLEPKMRRSTPIGW